MPLIQRHFSSESLPAEDCENAKHGLHAFGDVPTVVSKYVFASQFLHAANPVSFLYFPFEHAVHASPSTPSTDDVNPTLHLQAVRAGLPGRASEFADQF